MTNNKSLLTERVQLAEKILNKKFSGATGHLVYCPNNCSVLSAYVDQINLEECKSVNDIVNKITAVIIGNNIGSFL